MIELNNNFATGNLLGEMIFHREIEIFQNGLRTMSVSGLCMLTCLVVGDWNHFFSGTGDSRKGCVDC